MAGGLTFTKEAMDALQAIPPGTIAPKEGPQNPQGSTPELGPNNENLKDVYPEVVAALQMLVLEYRTEGIVGRRHEIRRIKKNRLFWQQQQYTTGWDADQQDWQMPANFSSGGGSGLRTDEDEEAEAGGRYQYVTNFYVGYGDSFISAFSSDVPTIHWYPQNAQDPTDIATAKAASEIEDLIQEQNQVDRLLQKVALCMWTDGKLGAFVRYVSDGQRFGFHDNPIVSAQPQKVGDDAFRCPRCGQATPQGGLYAGMVCPNCGTQLSQDNFQEAPMISVPVVTGYDKVPNGQVVISIVGGLELNTPVWANEIHEMPYLQWQLEVHEAKLRATYPQAADKIIAGNVNDADDVYARASRIAIQQGLPTTHPGDALVSLITYTRNWIQPWAFGSQKIKDDVRAQLLQLFPDGCYCAFAGETYCESRNEQLTDHWRVLHAREGDGQNRLAVGDPLIPVQERYNTWSNITTENIEYGIPPIVADSAVVDFDAINVMEIQPANWFPAKAKPGQPLAQSFFQPEPAKIPAETLPMMQEMSGNIAQFLTGIFPAVFGGEMQGAGGNTLGGYALARDQAMGRLGVFYRVFKSFWAEVMTLAVQIFCENATQDTVRSVEGEDGELDQKIISIGDLRGKAKARPEADETFPIAKSAQRGVLLNILQMAGDTELAQIFEEPANLREIKSTLGLNDFVIPGEDSCNKQMREIQQMLQSAPIQTMAPGPDGMPQPQMMSTIEVDPLLDDHAAEFSECKRWANSPAGIKAKMQNPAGFANVRAHAQTHFQQMQQAQGNAQKPPTESINYKDLPPDGQAQMAGQAGIRLNPADLEAKQQQDKADKAAELRARLGLKNKEKAA